MLHVLHLEYTEPMGAVKPHVPDHKAFLDRHHAAGTFVLSGRTDPAAEGGVILAVGVDRERAEEIAAEDPFVRAGVVRYRITTVVPGHAHPAVAALVGGRSAPPA